MIATGERPTGWRLSLAELLVIVLIASVLLALMLPAATRSGPTPDGAITFELAGLEQALAAYKLKYGELPPNFNDPSLVAQHLTTRYPDIAAAEVARVSALGLDPTETLPFWLGAPSPSNAGLRNGSGEPQLFFNFDQGRLIDSDGDGWFEYSAPHSRQAPYVYFDSRSYAFYYGTAYTVPAIDGIQRGTAKPYVTATTPAVVYANPETFQIISAGLDGNFGVGGNLVPTGPFLTAERDNLANFSNGRTLQDNMP